MKCREIWLASEPKHFRGCKNGACTLCLNSVRRPLIKEAPTFANKYCLRGAHITVASDSWKTDIGELNNFDYQFLLNEARRLLAEFAQFHGSDFWALGVVEVTLNEDAANDDAKLSGAERKLGHCWSPHLHFEVVCRCPANVIPFLQKLVVGKQPKSATPIKLVPSYCIGRHVAYITKYHPER